VSIAIVTAVSIGACGDDPTKLDDGAPTPSGAPRQDHSPDGPSGGGGPGGSTAPGDVPTNSPGGKAFFISDIHPMLAPNCGTCHDSAGPGPNWIIKADAEKSYSLMFQLGYVSMDSRILNKGPHGGVTTNVLTDTQKQTFVKWVSMEIKDGGSLALPNVLDKLSTCIDKTKFDAIGLGALRTIQRNDGNNTNNVTPWNENANRCTGCNNARCMDCHSADPGSGFSNAIGNQALPADYTFNQTKLTNPTYLQKYFGVSPTGDPIASHAIENKALATSKDVAYTHPYFTLTDVQVTAIQAFVDDATARYKAGTCGTATPPATPPATP
jgi:hypothetical protein